MLFFKAAVLSLLPFLVAAATKKPALDKCEQFHAKALTSAPLKLDDSAYGRLTAAPRDYSVAILLTALESRFGCNLCREFQPEWELLSKSWTKGDKKGVSRLIYGTLDFTDGKATFQSVGLFPPYLGALLIPAAGSSNSTCPSSLPAHHRTTCSRG